jgi:hypothetical protein
MSALDTQVGGDHYKKLKIQPVEYMHANGIPFIEGCIIKYASRWRDKGGIADLEKIKHFAQLLIDLETSEINGVEDVALVNPSHIISDIPRWDDAPEWATHLMVANFEIAGGRKYQYAVKHGAGYYDEPYTLEASRFITEGQPQLWLVHSDRPTSTTK